MLTLADPLEHARRLHGARTAIVDGTVRRDFATLYERCARLGVVLERLGVKRGDRVAVLAANGAAMFELFFGVPASGRIVVPLNTRLAAAELETILDDSGARVLFTDRDPGPLRARVDRVVSISGDYERLLAPRADVAPTVRPPLDEDAIAALFYTGGTTGRPKGVVLTHRNLVANAFHKTIACSLTGEDVFLAAAAMFHVAGIAPLVGLVWLGATAVTVGAFDPGECLDLVERHRITVMMPVPTMLNALVAAQRARPRDVSSLRMLGHAGSPIANAAILAAHAAFPFVELAQFYGATETCSIVTCLRNEQACIGTSRLGSCGRAVAGVSVRVVREDRTPARRGEVGEIWVRAPSVSPGYWGDPEATAAAFVEGWYRTGDAGVLDDAEHLFVVDRLKDMIVSGGENVYSIEVEDALQRHAAVLEAAVFGIPDNTWGEAVHAVVVIDERSMTDTLVAELRDHCRTLIAGYKVPKRIEMRTEPLPKSGPGKVLKRALRAPYWRAVSGALAAGRTLA